MTVDSNIVITIPIIEETPVGFEVLQIIPERNVKILIKKEYNYLEKEWRNLPIYKTKNIKNT